MIIFIINRLVVRNTLVTDVKQAARTFVRAWTEFSFSVRMVVVTTARIIIEVKGINSVIYLQVKETSRLHGISTKGELSQLAVLLHELVLQVTWKKHAGSIIPKKRSSSPHHSAILRYFRRSSGCSPRKQSLSCELHPAAPRRLCSWTSPTLRRCPGITSPGWRRVRCFFFANTVF